MRRSIAQIGLRQRALATGQSSINSTLILAALFALALPLLWNSLTATPAIRIDVGAWGDHAYLSGVNDPEENATETYRWTRANATLTLPNLNSRYQLLRIRAHGWRPPGQTPPKVQISVAGQLLTTIQTSIPLRTYDILLPYDRSSPSIQVEFASELSAKTHDQRQIGVAIDWIELERLDNGGPAPWQFGGQTLLLALALALLRALALPPGWAISSAAVLIAALLGANAWQPLWVSAALLSWSIVATLLLAATWLIRPWFSRLLAPWMGTAHARVAWALLIATLALRLLGATHPLFDIHDLSFHKNWLTDVVNGQLYIYSTPSEFQNRQTFNPPAGYLLLAPLWLLLPSPRLALQVGLGLVDTLGALFLLGLSRELGLKGRAGLLALALYAALPINMTMLWWGFTTNALAQSVGLLLFWLLLRLAERPSAGRQAAFGAACAAGMLTHIGALVLIGALVGTCIVLGWRRIEPAGRAAAIRMGALALACTALFYFSAVANISFSSPASGGGLNLRELIAQNWDMRGTRLELMRLGLLRGFLPLPLALAPLGLLQMLKIQPRQPLGRSLIVSWLAVCLLFFGVYMGLGLVVRYLYFAAPLICIWLGVLLNRLWQHHGRLMTIALVLLVVWSGVALWAGGVLMRIKPSGVPLTY